MQTENSRLESILKEHMSNDQRRLDRIEEKIDKLADTVIALARAEEKLVNLEESKKQINETLETQEKRLDGVEKRLSEGDVTLKTITRLFWITITSVIGALVVYFGGPQK